MGATCRRGQRLAQQQKPMAPNHLDHGYAAFMRRKPFHIAVAAPDSSTRT